MRTDTIPSAHLALLGLAGGLLACLALVALALLLAHAGRSVTAATRIRLGGLLDALAEFRGRLEAAGVFGPLGGTRRVMPARVPA